MSKKTKPLSAQEELALLNKDIKGVEDVASITDVDEMETDLSNDLFFKPDLSNMVEMDTDTLFLHLPFAERIRKQKTVKHKFPAYYAEKLGKVFVLSLNHVTFPIKFDGGDTYLPEEVFNYFNNVKLPKILNSSIQVNHTDTM